MYFEVTPRSDQEGISPLDMNEFTFNERETKISTKEYFLMEEKKISEIKLQEKVSTLCRELISRT